ncbi:hypothetical protein [Lactobacillus plantarum JDM1] [Lactiplantibacillus mudanjiangensis]|uniref:hypothetical protein n=1 Tax=Lactiplantibacillus mudanjiangensis TaxID=1296538 RepID=UPI001014D41A|nr:hypothetical protein [Lactobacillus plantarum JDM1] [Lactiplantibacillus mudanjiangensis]
MKRKEPQYDHIDSEELLQLVRSVESKHNDSVVEASKAEMKPIWDMVKIPAQHGRPPVKVSSTQCQVIESYAAKRQHTSAEKDAALKKLGKDYKWLGRRLREYRLSTLKIEDEGDN